MVLLIKVYPNVSFAGLMRITWEWRSWMTLLSLIWGVEA